MLLCSPCCIFVGHDLKQSPPPVSAVDVPPVSVESTSASESKRVSFEGTTLALILNATVSEPTLPYNSIRCNQDCPLCPKIFVGKDCRKELAKHVNKHPPNPDDPRLQSWLVASQRSWCSACASSYSQRQLHECKGLRTGPEVSSPPLQFTPPADPEVRSEVACLLPEWMEFFSTSIPSVKRVPQQCRVLVAKAFSTILRNCAVSGTKEQELRAWKLQFLFPKCVLRVQPEVRGQEEKAQA